jgi:hypothetical protein
VARDVYSLRIFSQGGLIPASGVVGPLVPAGLVYVVRDMDIVRRTTGSTDELVIYNQTLGLLVNVNAGMLDTGQNYRWRGRQIYNEGEQFGVQSIVGTWDVAVSGYQLTLP